MKKNKYKTWSDSFEHQNKTTTWSYGHFQKLIETECKFKTNLTLVEVGVARGGHIDTYLIILVITLIKYTE